MKNGFDIFRKSTLCRNGGLCLALSMLAALSVISMTNAGSCGRALTADSGAKSSNSSDSAFTEIAVSAPVETAFDDNGKIKNACREYKNRVKKDNRKDNKKDNKKDSPKDSVTAAVTTTAREEIQSTTSTTQPDETENTTVTTTVTTQTVPTTAGTREHEVDETARVSNGRQPFNYNDVSSIAADLNTLGDFADRLSPSLVRWDREEYDESGCVRVTLESEFGIVVLDVKQINGDTPGSEQTGSVAADSLGSWQWFQENRSAGCNISSVTWLSSGFGISPARGIGIGSTLAQLTDNYLCVNGGATTLYKASDVIEDQNKLNAILAAENLYTFVGGRVYSIGSYLDKYYNGREHTFRFENCDYIVQYGCNSIMDHNYTTGSWIIEYAVMEDSVIGINFMNKSYYRNEQKTAISTNAPSSGSESSASAVVTVQTDVSEIPRPAESDTPETETESVDAVSEAEASSSEESAGSKDETEEEETEEMSEEV